MVTSVMRGVFLTNSDARAEFLRLIEGQGYRNG
jgi:GTP cyclohydrolase I